MEHKYGQDVVSWTWMISGPAKCGFVEEAVLKFMYMDVEPNYATLVIVMSACFSLGAFKFERGFCEEAARLFQQMVQGGEAEPNEATIVNISSACSSIGALSLGQWIHPYYGKRWEEYFLS
ncbi:hypothetical protein L3X38_027170 [Prunus dulcis]|uniref:Pentatricopeptide repeat-containing protein n=1 Tax=Prunus dulcis TaxID=3755 RepID=A0AAD4Z063_PRUDU|nr:hypothetical protein L3X38_027170 [Prunus dulcis]